MTSETLDIEKLHFEHKLWDNELSFFQDELAIYEHRLEILVRKSGDKNMLAQLEHFQNQFIRHKEVLDQLKHDIKIHEQLISGLAKDNGKAGKKDRNVHENTKEQMETFRKIYGELKQDFYQFMAKYTVN